MSLHGQVTGKTTTASGAVTAFYTRSSDDYNTGNHGDFDEIDYEVGGSGSSVCACTRRQLYSTVCMSLLSVLPFCLHAQRQRLPSPTRTAPAVPQRQPERPCWTVAEQLPQGHVGG